MKNLSEGNDAKFLAFAKEIQSLENVEKNYRGKMQGLKRTNLLAEKQQDEEAMQQLSKEDQKNVIPRLQELWKLKTAIADQRYSYMFLTNNSAPFYAAQTIRQYRKVYQKATQKEQKQKIVSDFTKAIFQEYTIVDRNLEIMVLKELLLKINKGKSTKIASNGKMDLGGWISEHLSKDKLLDTGYVFKALRKKPEALLNYQSHFTKLYDELEPEAIGLETQWNQIDQQIKAIMPVYLEMKQAYKQGQFIPDANSTLRFTYGYIKRYKPNDAEIHLPYTTLNGVFEKANTAPDYRLPSSVADNLKIKEIPSVFKDKETGEVVVAFLYNLDTTGGNSGSAVLDADGNLIGVNFDRSFTATINDYAWNDRYSRSIGCDIRYVLFVLKYVGKADHILSEIGINL